ncbi:hypothetical protein D3C71_1890750 [compost metagenome]
MQGALLARGGALVGQPIADGQVAFAGKQAQANHQHHAGHAAAQLAYPTSNAVPRLHQGSAGRTAGDAEALIEHAQLLPGAGVFFIGRMPSGERFALHRTAATGVEGQLPGNGSVEYPRRDRP